jgi:hypothetical protein
VISVTLAVSSRELADVLPDVTFAWRKLCPPLPQDMPKDDKQGTHFFLKECGIVRTCC